MCGIVGAFTSEHKLYKSPAVGFFKQALFADTIRGWDSTGIAVMNQKMAEPEVYKKALAGPDFLELRHVKNMLDDSKDWSFMLGHNRAATRGGVEHDTSHPFQYGDITLVHNGTVTNHRMLSQGHKFNVDSEAICNAINLDGIEAVVAKLQGAFTLVWHDASDNSLNVVRNEERPIWMAVVEGGETLLMCSEGQMLQWLSYRSGYKTTKIFQPNPGVKYKYYVGSSDNWANEPETEVLHLAPKHTTLPYNNGGTGTRTTTTTNQSSTTNSPIALTRNTLKDLGQELSSDNQHLIVFKVETVTPSGTGAYGKKLARVAGSIVGVMKDHDVLIYSADEEEWTKHIDKVVLGTVQTAFLNATPPRAPVVVVDKDKTYTVYDTEVEAIGEKKLQEKSSQGGSGDDSKKSKGSSDLPGEPDPTKDLYPGHGRSYYPATAMENLLKHGCGNCTADIYLEDVENIIWLDHLTPICETCAILYDDKKHVTH